jgi:hypothetical protein
MKNNKGKIHLVTVFLIAFCWMATSPGQSLPDPDGIVQVTSVPTNAIYWSITGALPPTPFDLLPELSLVRD